MSDKQNLEEEKICINKEKKHNKSWWFTNNMGEPNSIWKKRFHQMVDSVRIDDNEEKKEVKEFLHQMVDSAETDEMHFYIWFAQQNCVTPFD